MASKNKLAKKLEKLSKKFLEKDDRKVLLDSLKNDKTEWFTWISQMKGILKNIDNNEAIKFSGLLLLLKQSPDSDFHQNNLKKFLIDKVEFYKHYDFSLEEELVKKETSQNKIWVSKFFRLFISRSFLGILILVLIVSFIVWFYLDRKSCLEFVNGVVGPFLKAIR
ncbi:hypothetical protein KKH07_01465 [Patescibacteria group bacterium]|nr:hypothetical protein [Patescibacteria group bacterium]MBU2068456.1 hypothetical protein [Patescibacteria group bacterium]